MKRIITILLFTLSIKSYAQFVFADPALNQVSTITVVNEVQDPTMLPLDGTIQLSLPILNRNTINAIPAGSCKVKIGLGSKLVLDPAFDLANTNTSTYFNWTAVNEGGQVQLTGDLKTDLPANFITNGLFRVKGSIVGNSTVTINFLVTNHNTPVTLSDDDPNNNTSFLPYTVINPIPVNFSGINVQKDDCTIKINFSAENEVNVRHYEIEASNNGIQFIKMRQLAADHRINYSSSFLLSDIIKAPFIKVRVKSVDFDGKVQYTETKNIKGTCDDGVAISLYPNPLPASRETVTIRANGGTMFNGNITIVLLDVTGRIIHNTKMAVANTNQFAYTTGLLTAGQYLIKLQVNTDVPIILPLQRL
jgi:hypothetical protein